MLSLGSLKYGLVPCWVAGNGIGTFLQMNLQVRKFNHSAMLIELIPIQWWWCLTLYWIDQRKVFLVPVWAYPNSFVFGIVIRDTFLGTRWQIHILMEMHKSKSPTGLHLYLIIYTRLTQQSCSHFFSGF